MKTRLCSPLLSRVAGRRARGRDAGRSALKPFQRGSWQDMLRTHAGRPTMVHFWGVTCGPCKVELPLLGKFMKDIPGSMS